MGTSRACQRGRTSGDGEVEPNIPQMDSTVDGGEVEPQMADIVCGRGRTSGG